MLPGEVGLTRKGKAGTKVKGVPEKAGEAVTTSGEGVGSRRVVAGRGWLTNNGVNAAMAGVATVGGIVGWAVWKGLGVQGVQEELGTAVERWVLVLGQ